MVVRRTLWAVLLLWVVCPGAFAAGPITLATDAGYESNVSYPSPSGLAAHVNQPHAFYVASARKTYFCYEGQKSSGNYSLRMNYYDHVTGLPGTPQVIVANTGSNDVHIGPACIQDASGYFHLVYGDGNVALSWVKSTNPNDITAWGSPSIIVAGAGNGIYAGLTKLPSGTLVVFYEDDNTSGSFEARPVFVKTLALGGTSWSGATKIWEETATNYKVSFKLQRQSSDGVIHMIWENFWWNDATDNRTHHIYYAKSTNGTTWTDAAGNSLTVPMTNAVPKAFTTASADTTHGTEALDIDFDEALRPVILLIDGTLQQNFVLSRLCVTACAYKVATWTGSAWVASTVVASGPATLSARASIKVRNSQNIEVYYSDVTGEVPLYGTLKRTVFDGTAWSTPVALSTGGDSTATFYATRVEQAQGDVELMWGQGTSEPSKVMGWGLGSSLVSSNILMLMR